METIRNSLAQSHEIVRQCVQKGDTVVDATAGNGNDTVFLAALVGCSGKVYAFDIQKQAIEKTRFKLQQNRLEERVVLIQDGHESMDEHVRDQLSCVMFNLGYLPGGDHSIGTRFETTVEALKKAMELIRKNGIISMVVYYGGDSGFDEKEHVMAYIRTIDPAKFSVMKTEFVNQVNCPPILVCIEKL